MHRKKLRVIVRPWQPKNLPYAVTQTHLKTFIQTHVAVFDEILYLGWARRVVDGKRVIKFFVATGPTRLVAKQRFKEGAPAEGELWEINSSTLSALQALPDPA
jgi:hypothetical protein